MTTRRLALLGCASLMLAACTLGPDYHRPEVSVPAAYKEADGWKSAQPRDDAPRAGWWSAYGDPELDALVAQVAVSNQNLRAIEAQYRQALALVAAARSSYFPTLSSGWTGSRSQGPGGASAELGVPARRTPVNTTKISATANWELDLWGELRRTVESNEAAAAASNADLSAALLSAQSTLVQSYAQLRANDAQRRLLDDTVKGYERSLQITRNRYKAGVAARLDVAQAETLLTTTRAQAIDLGVQRAQLEHAIALLIGKAPAEFSLAPTGTLPALPDIPLEVPSALLERRPDIAASERRVAAANAKIGVAQAAYFPSLNLNASAGFQAASFGRLIALPNSFWSLGPILAETLFDGGLRDAETEQAIASYDQSVAQYRETVLTGFQEVEDNLVTLRVLAEESLAQEAAVRAAEQAAQFAMNQYQAGTVDFLTVVTAQSSALSSKRSGIDLTARRLVASAGLVKALGGGWHEEAGH